VETNNPALEQIWRDLRPHIEWAPGFALVFLFASHPGPVRFLRRRLEESLQLRPLRLGVLEPSAPAEMPRLVEQIIAARPDPGRGPLWVELWRGTAEEGWAVARRQALQRLNERRALLERDVGLPMVLILPQSERGRVYIDAPDLLAVRCFTAELTAVNAAARVPETTRAEPSHPDLGAPPGPVELEWARLLKRTKDRSRLDLRDAFAAFESAIERGDLSAAETTAVQTLEIARERVKKVDDTPQGLRDLSIALDNVGQVERDLGNLEAARKAYRESLDVRRQLVRTFPDQLRYQQDLAFTEARLGEIS
jgi:hypothetical protein